jgi:hypothetical protein
MLASRPPPLMLGLLPPPNKRSPKPFFSITTPSANPTNMITVTQKLKLLCIQLLLFALFAAEAVHGDKAVDITPWSTNINATPSKTESNTFHPTLVQYSSLYIKHSGSVTQRGTPMAKANEPTDKSAQLRKLLLIIIGACGLPGLVALVWMVWACNGLVGGTKEWVRQRRLKKERQEEVRQASFTYEHYP